MSLVRGLSFFGLCFAFVVIALGAWTRLVDAGLGCPDWPGCYGFVVFPTTEAEILIAEQRYPQFPYEIDKAIPEVVHRYFAAALGFIAILLVAFSFKHKLPARIKAIASFSFVFYLFSGVIWLPYKLEAFAHNCNWPFVWRLYYFKLIFYLFLNTTDGIKNHQIGHLKTLGCIALVALLIQIFLAWTSTNYASLACVDFPTCQGTYLPEMNFSDGFNLSQVGLIIYMACWITKQGLQFIILIESAH